MAFKLHIKILIEFSSEKNKATTNLLRFSKTIACFTAIRFMMVKKLPYNTCLMKIYQMHQVSPISSCVQLSYGDRANGP